MIIDRIENRIAIVECNNGITINIPVSELPAGVREGSILVKTEDGFFLDKALEKKRRKHLSERTKSIFKQR